VIRTSNSGFARRQPQDDGDFYFQALVGENRDHRAVSLSTPVPLPSQATARDAARVERMVLERLEAHPAPPKIVSGPDYDKCGNSASFLFTVRDMVQSAVAGGRVGERKSYWYNAMLYTLTLVRSDSVSERKVSIRMHGDSADTVRVYKKLRRAEFDIYKQPTGEHFGFEMLLGTTGALAGVPVQIEYRPSWWLRLVLNLVPQQTEETGGVPARAALSEKRNPLSR
jgi:hypothetical protein